jgi:hypothetical protein
MVVLPQAVGPVTNQIQRGPACFVLSSPVEDLDWGCWGDIVTVGSLLRAKGSEYLLLVIRGRTI